MAKVQDCSLVVSEFEFQSCYYVQFLGLIPLGKA